MPWTPRAVATPPQDRSRKLGVWCLDATAGVSAALCAEEGEATTTTATATAAATATAVTTTAVTTTGAATAVTRTHCDGTCPGRFCVEHVFQHLRRLKENAAAPQSISERSPHHSAHPPPLDVGANCPAPLQQHGSSMKASAPGSEHATPCPCQHNPSQERPTLAATPAPAATLASSIPRPTHTRARLLCQRGQRRSRTPKVSTSMSSVTA